MTTKIKLSDTILDVVVKMGEGNPGALRVCTEILQEDKGIDPDNTLGGLETVLALDTLGIYGARIWMLYKDVCGEDLTKTLAVLRGWQLGQLAEDVIHHAIDNWGAGIDCDDVLAKVQVRLPMFGQLEEGGLP